MIAAWANERGSRGDRRWSFGAALLLVVGLSLAPPTVGPAAAATGRLLVSAAATYTLDPSAGAVHVSVAVKAKNDKPDSNNYYYTWRDLSWGVHPEATNIRVRDGIGSLHVKATAKDGYLDAEFRLRRDLLYGQTAKLTISWDLPGGAPRSESPIRAGEAFAAFDLWAWGDPGSSSVTANLPAGFEATTVGSMVETASGAGGVTITASAATIGDPADFWTSVTAVRDRSLTSETLTLPGDIRLVVKGWPEDPAWRTQVSSTLRGGLPKLKAMVGLPWPVSGQLEVTEVYAPLLEGYAGIYYTDEQRIDISEELDDLTIVHEGSHAWFNDTLFTDRWIDEGLADTYAANVLVELGQLRKFSKFPLVFDGRVDLELWTFPGRITDETEARETYGYNASWYVVDLLYREVGPDGMRAIFAAANDDTIAYIGAPSPETVGKVDDWRRFLDLLEEIGGSAKADELFRSFVVSPASRSTLDVRQRARDAYASLVASGDGWLPPIYVRSPMGGWEFDRATTRMTEAAKVLDLSRAVAGDAGALGLVPDDALKTAYETATDGFATASAVAASEQETLAALASTKAALAATPDFVTSVGLIGVLPESDYDAAAAAFEAGDLDGAEALAAAALQTETDAPRVGRERVTVVVAGGGGLIALLVLIGVGLRRRRRRLVVAAAPFRAVSGEGSATEAYGTLAAESPVEPPAADDAGGTDGGAADGEGSSSAPAP